MQKTSTESLASKSLNALKWNYIGRFISLSLQFSIGVVLARLLGPEPFGLVAIALFVQGLGNLFAEGGLGSALIQSQDIDEHDIRSVFTTQILIGLITSAVIIGLAPLLAGFFHEPNATPVIMAMALSFTLQAFGQTANALIRREFEFKKIQLISIVSYCIGYIGLGLPLAFMDYGVWSLVAAQLSQTTLNSVGNYIYHRHAIFPLVNPKNCRFLRFGAAITFNNITSWGIGCIDTAIIGRYFDTATLGIYNRAFNLLNMPNYAVVASLQTVLLSTYSKSQDNKDIVAQTYILSVGIMALIFLPIFTAVAACADSVVLGIYGDKWATAIPMMTPLAIAIAVHSMLAMTGPMLTGIGLPRYELNAQVITLLFSIPALIFAAHQSIIVFIYALVGTFLLRFLLLTIVAHIALKITPYRFIKMLITPCIIAFMMYACTFYTNTFQLNFNYDVKLRLLGNICSATIYYILLLSLFKRLIFSREIKDFILPIKGKIPKPLIKIIGL
jgi:PST family polysaccharide transporter